jgi:L-ascorbate metabolism protein UlaG (beta-lactamase superfamily)
MLPRDSCPGRVSRVLLFIAFFAHAGLINPGYAQSLTMEQIRANLLANPPNSLSKEIRKQTIFDLDQILKDDGSRTALAVQNFYNAMMQKVQAELADTVKEGAVVWMMYNHGFIVKTRDIVFAFDVIRGYSGWNQRLSADIIKRIDVLFLTHAHGDHNDGDVASQVMANGGTVITPTENANLGNFAMAPEDTVTVRGLRIKAYFGLHSVPVRMYEVTCPNGTKFFHTGDDQTSKNLPAVDNIDVLLLDAWINDSGSSFAVDGMISSIQRLRPKIMVPGHIHELGHAGPTHGAVYGWAQAVADASTCADVRVMAWGERLVVVNGVATKAEVKNNEVPNGFQLSQNYPNPFNPATNFEFRISSFGFVSIKVFDLLGREVAVLVDESKNAGSYRMRWDASSVPSGMYVCRMTAGTFVSQIKLMIVR